MDAELEGTLKVWQVGDSLPRKPQVRYSRHILPSVFAAADIGSNTVHLLVARVAQGRLERLDNRSQWLSLGEAVARQGFVPEKLAATATATLARYVQVSAAHRAKACYIFATESFRRASGAARVAEMVEARTGLAVDIVTPEREAELGLRGALLDCDGPTPALFAECGGGSVQLARFVDRTIEWDRSLPIGTGTLRAKLDLDQPASAEKVAEVRAYVRRTMPGKADLSGALRIVASGGVARGLVRALHPDGDRTLHKEELEYLAWATSRLTRGQVATRFRVKPQRAGTLLAGSLVFLEVMKATRHEQVTVSEHGVREGAILTMAGGGFKKWRL